MHFFLLRNFHITLKPFEGRVGKGYAASESPNLSSKFLPHLEPLADRWMVVK